MKRKSSSSPNVSDEEECKDMLLGSVKPEMKGVETVKGTSSHTFFDFGEFDHKHGGIQIPKGVETIEGHPSSIPEVSHEEECKDMLPVSDDPETKEVGSMKRISSKGSFDFGEFDQKPGSIQIPKAEETLEGKSSFTLFGSDITFSERKEVESIKGKSSSILFESTSEQKISDFALIKPKAEPIEEKPSSTFFGSGAKIPDSDFTSSDPKGEESIKEKSSFSSGGSYDVVLDFANTQDDVEGSILSESLRTCLKSFEIYVSKPDIDVLEVGITGKVFIPVFSKGFAYSESCLQNLVSMVDCRSYSDTNHIIPICFGVEPSDVRLDTPLYRQGLDKLRRNVDDMAVNRWTEALIHVSNISGEFIIPETAGPNEIDYFMKEVCQMILHKLRLSRLSKGTYLVGMNRHVENIIDMLNLGVNNVEVLVIQGKEGSGKTTLARAVYDKLSSSFEGCSFISSMDGGLLPNDPTTTFQAQLVSDLLKRKVKVIQSEDEGMDIIRKRFCNTKVLIVLDGAWYYFQVECLVGKLNWFGPGSRIIITTKIDLGITFDHSAYDMSSHRLRLSDEEVFDLFKRYAFPKSYPFANFDTLWKELPKAIIRRDDFCLLEIEIVGSLLYGKSKAEWESMFLHLKQAGRFKSLEEVLRMSYESLTEKQKEMFLDVACLPDGIDRRIILLLSHDSLHSQSFLDLEVLIGLSLVKIDANNGVWMHNFVRNFCRRIIKNPAAGLVDIGTMRFFKITDGIVTPSGTYERRRRNIVYESQFPNLVHVAHPAKSLKVLDLSWSEISEKWESWRQIKAPQLKVLNLTGCFNLMITPNFSFCPDLEILILEYCSQLVKIDPSIQGLQRLATLNLRYCMELSVLPKEIGCLNALSELFIDGTSIQEIPVSIGYLKKLQVLTAINCSSLTQLPSLICNLHFITELRLDRAKIAEFPCSILQRLKLQYLSLRNCRSITNLGSFVGEVERSLIELDVSGTSISELSRSISNLKNLRVLKMEYCFIGELPPGLGELKKLEEIYASWCKRLENLPHDIGGVESLRILKVGHTQISVLPKSIQLLEDLEILDCTSCNKLQGLPELPSSLTSLHVQSKEFRALPDLRNLEKLKEYTLGNDAAIIHRVSPHISEGSDPFDWLKSSYSIRTLALYLPHTKKLPGFPLLLRKLTLQCTNLEHVPSLPSTLVVISIRDFRLLKKLPSVESLQSLIEMEVVSCPKIRRIKGLGRLKALQILTVSDCPIKLLGGLGQLVSLKRLALQDCRSLSKLTNIERLNQLQEMKIIGCPQIERIVGLEGLQELQVLSISDCGIRSVIGLDNLHSLTRLTIQDCPSLHDVPDLSRLRNLNEKCVLLEDQTEDDRNYNDFMKTY